MVKHQRAPGTAWRQWRQRWWQQTQRLPGLQQGYWQQAEMHLARPPSEKGWPAGAGLPCDPPGAARLGLRRCFCADVYLRLSLITEICAASRPRVSPCCAALMPLNPSELALICGADSERSPADQPAEAAGTAARAAVDELRLLLSQLTSHGRRDAGPEHGPEHHRRPWQPECEGAGKSGGR